MHIVPFLVGAALESWGARLGEKNLAEFGLKFNPNSMTDSYSYKEPFSEKVPLSIRCLMKIAVIGANILSLPSQIVGIIAGGLAGLKGCISVYKFDKETFFNHAQRMAKITTAVAGCILFPLNLPVEIFGSFYRKKGGYHSDNYFFLDRLFLKDTSPSPMEKKMLQSIKEFNSKDLELSVKLQKTYLSHFLYILHNVSIYEIMRSLPYVLHANSSIIYILFNKLKKMDLSTPADKLKQAVLLEVQEFIQLIDQIIKVKQSLEAGESSVYPDRHFQCVFCQHLLYVLLDPYSCCPYFQINIDKVKCFPQYFQKYIDEVKNSYLQNPILHPDLKFILEIENILLSDKTELEKTKQLIAYISNQKWTSPQLEKSVIEETLQYLSNDGMALGKASLFIQSSPEAVRCAITNNVEASQFVFEEKDHEGTLNYLMNKKYPYPIRELARCAIDTNPEAAKFAEFISYDGRNNLTKYDSNLAKFIILEQIRLHKAWLDLIPDKYKNDLEIVEFAVRQNITDYHSVPEDLKKHPRILKAYQSWYEK